MRSLLVCVALCAGTSAIALRAAAAEWPPDSLVNIQALPKDTSVRELRTMMRGFAGALGVRCTHCHVGDDPNDLTSIDFTSDEKIEKRKAREMIRMVRRINEELLARRLNPEDTLVYHSDRGVHATLFGANVALENRD